jgi:hypothetical protein
MTRVIIQLDHSDESEDVVEEPQLQFKTLDEAIKFLINTKVAESKPKGKWRDPVANWREQNEEHDRDYSEERMPYDEKFDYEEEFNKDNK